MFTGVNTVTTVFLLIQKHHLISESELAFSFSTSAAFVAVSVLAVCWKIRTSRLKRYLRLLDYLFNRLIIPNESHTHNVFDCLLSVSYF